MKKENGITLIALIITIIVMLILVGVTINVALNGGLFYKAKTASIQTEIAQIQEQLVLAKATAIANNNGYIPSNYGITLSDLELPKSIKTKYADKLIISSDGTLYYTENAKASDIVYFENAGITAYQEQTPVEEDPTPVTQNPVIYGTDTDYIVVMPDNKTAYLKLASLGVTNLSQLSIEDHPTTYFASDLQNQVANFSVNTSDIYTFIVGDKTPVFIYDSINDCWYLSGLANSDTAVMVVGNPVSLYTGENSATILDEVNNYNS